MKNLLPLLLFFAVINVVAGQEADVVLETNTGTIHGTLLVPNVSKPPLVILIAGSGPTDRNGNNPVMINNSLKMLADGLAKEGIASLRYDKRGVAESQTAGGKEDELRFDQYVLDAIGWVNQMNKIGQFSSVNILGHSEGALIGLLAAKKTKVKSYISLAGAADNAADILYQQLSTQMPAIAPSIRAGLDSLRDGWPISSYHPMLVSVFRPSVQPYIISWFKYTPIDELPNLKIPVLILQGTTDIQVGVDQAEKLKNANFNAELIIINGMNHILKEVEIDRMKNIQSYSKPELPLHPELLPNIVNFIKAN